jgi:hypothetical protein
MPSRSRTAAPSGLAIFDEGPNSRMRPFSESDVSLRDRAGTVDDGGTLQNGHLCWSICSEQQKHRCHNRKNAYPPNRNPRLSGHNFSLVANNRLAVPAASYPIAPAKTCIYLTLFCSQSVMTLAISWLFFSNIII